MKAVIPNIITPIVRNDGIAAQTMRAWMETVSQNLQELAAGVGLGVGSFTLDDGTATMSGVFLFDDGGA
jgi:hypothetical protein